MRVNTRSKGAPCTQNSHLTTCTRCGRTPTHDRRFSSARDAICRKCSKGGHFQAVCCSTAKVVEVHQEGPNTFLGGLDTQDSARNLWRVSLLLSGVSTEFDIDTGAEVSVISETQHQKVGSPSLSLSGKRLRGPSNHSLPVIGCFTGVLKRGSQEVQQEIFVVKNLRRHLLGSPAIEALGLAVRVGAIFDGETNSVQLFPQMFQGLGKLEGDYEMKLKPDSKPFAISVPRRVAVPLMGKVRAELERME